MAAKRGRSITNFGGFLNPFAIGGGPPVVPATTTVSLSLYRRSSSLTLRSRLVSLSLFSRAVSLTLRPWRSSGMTHSLRECIESGPIPQGVDELVAYDITTTPWGSSPTSPAVIVKDVLDDYTDVTATLMPINTPSISGDKVTFSVLKDGNMNGLYRVELLFVSGGSTFEPWFEVLFER